MNTQNLHDQDRSALLSHVRRLLEETEKRSQRIMTLSNMSVEIHHATDLSELLKILPRFLDKVIPCDYSSLFLINIHDMWETHVIKQNPDTPVADHDINNPILQAVIENNASKILNDNASQFLPDYKCKLVVPIITKNRTGGTLQFASNTPYDGEDLRLGLMISYQIAALIDKFSQLELLIEMADQLTIFTHELIEQYEDVEIYNHTIAHDLKSPLSIIPVKVELIERLEKDLSEPSRKHLHAIREQVFYVNKIIDQLLILSQLDKYDTATSMLDVNHIVTNSLRRFMEVEEGIVTVDVQPDLPQARGHEQWLEEVFANLIGNAIKYRNENKAQPRITITGEIDDKRVVYSVSDNGIGIDPANQEHIFKTFNRVRDIEADGYGLGLTIVQRILQKVGGEIGLESEPGKGTRFWFSIPRLDIDSPV